MGVFEAWKRGAAGAVALAVCLGLAGLFAFAVAAMLAEVLSFLGVAAGQDQSSLDIAQALWKWLAVLWVPWGIHVFFKAHLDEIERWARDYRGGRPAPDDRFAGD